MSNWNNYILAKARFFRRFEKVLITLESLIIGIFFGFGAYIQTNIKSFGVIVASIVFICLIVYKRNKIKRG